MQGTIPGDLWPFPPDPFRRVKLKLWLNKIFRAASSEVVLETQVGPHNLMAPSVQSMAASGEVPRHAAQCSAFGRCLQAAAQLAESIKRTVRRFRRSARTAEEMSLCLLTRTVHKLPVIGVAKLPAAGGTAPSFERL